MVVESEEQAWSNRGKQGQQGPARASQGRLRVECEGSSNQLRLGPAPLSRARAQWGRRAGPSGRPEAGGAAASVACAAADRRRCDVVRVPAVVLGLRASSCEWAFQRGSSGSSVGGQRAEQRTSQRDHGEASERGADCGGPEEDPVTGGRGMEDRCLLGRL